MKRFFLLALCLSLSAPLVVVAQDKVKVKKDGTIKVKGDKHFVKTRPDRPTYSKIESPGADYIYIEDEWTWNPRSSVWEWSGNRWETVPKRGQNWVPGKWIETPQGWYWQPGYWR